MATEDQSTTQTSGSEDEKGKVSRYTKSIKECVKNGFKSIKEHNLHLYLGAMLLVLYCMWAYESHILQWYGKCIIDGCLSKIETNWALVALAALLVAICAYDICRKHRDVYRYDTRVIFLVALSLGITARYRLCGSWEYLRLWEGGLPYIDLLLFVGLAYVISSVWNWCRRRKNRHASEEGTLQIDPRILHDEPITDLEEDILGFGEGAKFIAQEIRKLDRNKTWSFAITARWGTGKTSFMNLVVGQLSQRQDEFAIIRFNPRASKSVGTIQEDFFYQLSVTLARYDSRCGRTIRDYMASLQLNDDRGVLEAVVGLYKMWDKEDLKERIEKAIGNIRLRVLVLIDDFDRLSRDEILEVLKLIGNNAAFPNLIFLTAFDKEQVNKYFGADCQTSDACFVDKFFCLQYPLPPRLYSYIKDFIKKQLEECMGMTEAEIQEIVGVLDRFREYVPTLRDAKRVCNQFDLDYERVRGEVILSEFFAVQLIKYRYPREFVRLYRGEFFQGVLGKGNVYLLKEDLKDCEHILAILKILFPESTSEEGRRFRHISERSSFENYFVGRVYNSLLIRDMKSVVFGSEPPFPQIDRWLEREDETLDIIGYLDSIKKDSFSSDDFVRYARITSYVAVKKPTSRAFGLLHLLLQDSNESGDGEHISSQIKDIDAYKQAILDIIANKEYDKDLGLLRLLYRMIRSKEIDEKELLIKGDDLWPAIKEEFLRRTEGSKGFDGGNELDWLHICLLSEEASWRPDEDCLRSYRSYVFKHPEQYVAHFPQLKYDSPDSISVGLMDCEPHWKEIFGDENGFEKFLKDCKERGIAGIDTVCNLWALYKANRMKQIFFVGQGRAQDKIDAKLVEEVAMLKRLEEIQSQLDTHSDQSTASLVDLESELEAIPLDIALRRELKERIRQLQASSSNR